MKHYGFATFIQKTNVAKNIKHVRPLKVREHWTQNATTYLVYGYYAEIDSYSEQFRQRTETVIKNRNRK